MTHGLDIFSYADAPNEGCILADAGIAQAETNNDEWVKLARIELENIWKSDRHSQHQWTFEMLKWPICRAIGEPSNWRALAGSLAKYAVKRGWAEVCGVTQAQNSQNHASLRRLYRWVSQ